MESPNPMLAGGNASIYISNMDTSIHFFTEILELTLITRIKDEWAEIDAGKGLIIGLHPARVPLTLAPGTAGAINIELRVNESQSLDEIVEILQGRGVRFNGKIANYEHVRLASLSDPDGNIILLAQTISIIN